MIKYNSRERKQKWKLVIYASYSGLRPALAGLTSFSQCDTED
jgi:hypothetical protein